MYSSSPQVIKHYVPMNFSKMTVDFKSSPKKLLSNVKPIEQNPLTNFKLKKLQDKPKDYVLIFKNKSVKQFMPRKKLNISPRVKRMRNKRIQQDQYQDDNVINIENFQLQEDFIRTSKSTPKLDLLRQRMTGFDNFVARGGYSNRQSKTSSTVRRKIKKAYNTSRQGSRDGKSSQRNRKTSIDKYDALFKEYQQKKAQKQRSLSLKVSGMKAPNSQIVDHFKRFAVESSNNYLMNKLVR